VPWHSVERRGFIPDIAALPLLLPDALTPVCGFKLIRWKGSPGYRTTSICTLDEDLILKGNKAGTAGHSRSYVFANKESPVMYGINDGKGHQGISVLPATRHTLQGSQNHRYLGRTKCH
jgi:hypothetical protein